MTPDLSSSLNSSWNRPDLTSFFPIEVKPAEGPLKSCFPWTTVSFFTSNCRGVLVCVKYTRKGCVIFTPFQGQYLDFLSGYCLPRSGKVGRYFPCILEDVYTVLNCFKKSQ